jgi:hypothetical protein
MRFTITQKIVTSLALLSVIGIVSMFTVYDGLQKVKSAMIELAEEKEPLVEAANEMEINMNEIAILVLRYLNTIDRRYRRRVEKDVRDFRRFHDQFFQLAGNQLLRELGIRIGDLYEDFQVLARELMDKKDKQEKVFSIIARHFEYIDTILDTRIQVFIDLESPDGFRKAVTSRDVEADIVEIGIWLANYQRIRDDMTKKLLFENEVEFRDSLEQFKNLSLTDEERRWIAIVEETFNQTMALIREVVGLEDYL